MKKDLTNIRLLLAELGNPERQLRCIHVGGTNGKGTTAHLIAAALQSAGFRVGLYTSPHYEDFRERIKINGQYIPEEEVVADVEAMRDLMSRVRPSFFEITVAMAFDYFARQRVDWAVVEVGLGGRLDSTNVIDPVLSVITNISKDHVQFLGDTLPKIAGEKAGIIKAGRPVVIGETQLETTEVFRRKASEVGAPIYFADQLWQTKLSGQSASMSALSISPARHSVSPFKVDVQDGSPHLPLNANTAFTALQLLHGLKAGYELKDEELKRGWAELKTRTAFFGRWQRLSERPLVIADSAHNEGGLKAAMEKLHELTSNGKAQLHLVIGVVDDKDLAGVLPLFPKQATYYFVNADIPRALPAASLAATALTYGLVGKVYSTVAAGLEVAKATAKADDVVYVGGSIFTTAEVLSGK